MLISGGPISSAPIGADGFVSDAASFSISPSSGHAVATVAITATGVGTTWSGSNPFSVSSGPGTISNYVNLSGTSATFDLAVSAVGGGPIVIADSNSATTQNYDNAAVVPGAPTIGTAVKGNTTASVPFTAPADNGGAAITDYTATSTPGSLTGSGASSPLTVTGLTNGTAYTFTVHATNSVGNSAESSASNSVTPSTVPGAPTSAVAVAGDNSASVSFTAPASTGGAAISGYRVTASTGQTATGASSPITVTGLTNGVAVTFTVAATNINGYGSESSASNSVTPADLVSILVRAPYLSTDTIGTKAFQVYDIQSGVLTAVGSSVTSGFSAIPNITNGWWALVQVAPNGAYGDFAGIAVFTGINDVPITPSSTNTGTDIITLPSAAGSTGQAVTVSATAGGLSTGTTYYWNAASTTTGSMHTTMATALAGTSKVDLTASITATLTFIGAAAVELYSPPTSQPTSLVIDKIAPFLSSDTITTAGYQLYDSSGAASGSHVTAGILPIFGIHNGYATKLTLTPDAAYGAQYGILWDGG